jgi:hypothetical protein
MSEHEIDGDVVAAGRRGAMIDEARLRLVVSFPPVTLSVREAENLRNGVIVDLGARLSEAVMVLQLEDEVIGTGRLLLVGSHAGVQFRSERE